MRFCPSFFREQICAPFVTDAFNGSRRRSEFAFCDKTCLATCSEVKSERRQGRDGMYGMEQSSLTVPQLGNSMLCSSDSFRLDEYLRKIEVRCERPDSSDHPGRGFWPRFNDGLDEPCVSRKNDRDRQNALLEPVATKILDER